MNNCEVCSGQIFFLREPSMYQRQGLATLATEENNTHRGKPFSPITPVLSFQQNDFDDRFLWISICPDLLFYQPVHLKIVPVFARKRLSDKIATAAAACRSSSLTSKVGFPHRATVSIDSKATCYENVLFRSNFWKVVFPLNSIRGCDSICVQNWIRN